MQRRLIEYIRKPDTLDAHAIAALRETLRQSPYCHAARILLLHALYRMHDATFDEELRRNAPLIPDRRAIFRLIEEKHYTTEQNRLRFDYEINDEEEVADRTQTLIDSFLQTIPHEQQTQPTVADATQDYIGFLMQHADEEDIPHSMPTIDEESIIDEFLQQDTPRIVIQNQTADTPRAETTQNDTEDDENEILTERLAHIYIKQGKFEKAIEIIQRLSLKYPKKNRYFADQIRFLGKLVINNRNNKQ
ncbi:MAG: hypothetical protein K5945_03675 [Bacteroidaceae bacterium]|nr:hypothetical protein [Bacteroidaceae bacterium]